MKFGVGSLDDSTDQLLRDDKRWTMMTDPSLSLTVSHWYNFKEFSVVKKEWGLFILFSLQQIEEQIEEVTTYSNSEDEDEKIASDNEGNLCIPDLKLLQRRVPFPEFGMDIVEGEIRN